MSPLITQNFSIECSPHTNLESSRQELVLDLQEIALALFTLERFIDDLEPMVVLDILPPTIAMTEDCRSSKRLKNGGNPFCTKVTP